MELPRPRLKHRAEFLAFEAVERLVATVPELLALNTISGLAASLARIRPARRDVIRENLRIAFGDSISDAERRRLEVESQRHLALMFVEAIQANRRQPEWVRGRIQEMDQDPGARQLVESGRPFISVSSHFGSWELMGAFASQAVPNLSAVAKPLHNPLVQRRVSAARAAHGLHILWSSSDNLPSEALGLLREGRVVNIFGDQDAGASGLFVPFFSREASTNAAPALLALRAGVPLLPVFLVRMGLGRHRFVLRPPIHPDSVPGDRVRDRVFAMTRRCAAELEDMIRLYPAQYFWAHRRWKTTPERVEARRERRLARSGSPDSVPEG